MPEAVEHVVVETPPEPASAAEPASLTQPAAAAVALAQASAAAAELDAAERVRDIENEADEWRSNLENQMAEHGQTLAQMSELVASQRLLEDARHTRDAELMERLNALEARLAAASQNRPQSTRENSNGIEGETIPERANLAGAE